MIANNLQYTPFNKVSSITDGDYTFTFQYNSNHERVKMEVENNNEAVMTKYYFGPTEMQETSEGTRTINHIGIGTGSLAMQVIFYGLEYQIHLSVAPSIFTLFIILTHEILL